MRLTLLMIALSLAGAAQAECKRDFSTTFESNADKPDFLPCRNSASGSGCRELNRHPRDFRNAMRNYMVQGGGLNEELSLATFQDFSQFAKTFCNDHGQCASVIMTLYFNTFDVNVSAGVVSTRLTLREALDEGAVRQFDLTVHMPNDTPYHTQGYSPILLDQNAPLANIPADSQPDPTEKGECLDNNGDKTNKRSATPDIPPSARLGYWYRPPVPSYAPPTVLPLPRSSGRICGKASVKDGPSLVTCYMN